MSSKVSMFKAQICTQTMRSQLCILRVVLTSLRRVDNRLLRFGHSMNLATQLLIRGTQGQNNRSSLLQVEKFWTTLMVFIQYPSNAETKAGRILLILTRLIFGASSKKALSSGVFYKCFSGIILSPSQEVESVVRVDIEKKKVSNESLGCVANAESTMTIIRTTFSIFANSHSLFC